MFIHRCTVPSSNRHGKNSLDHTSPIFFSAVLLHAKLNGDISHRYLALTIEDPGILCFENNDAPQSIGNFIENIEEPTKSLFCKPGKGRGPINITRVHNTHSPLQQSVYKKKIMGTESRTPGTCKWCSLLHDWGHQGT